MQFVDEFRDRHQARHRPERLAAKVGVDAGEDDAPAAVGKAYNLAGAVPFAAFVRDYTVVLLAASGANAWHSAVSMICAPDSGSNQRSTWAQWWGWTM